MAESKKSSANKQVMDVARPGKSAPTPTAKPVIVTNRPVLQGPMVGGGDTAKDAEASSGAAPAAKKAGGGGLVLQPLSSSKITVIDDNDVQGTDDEQKLDAPELPTVADSIPEEKPAQPEPEATPAPQPEPEAAKTEEAAPAEDKKPESEPEEKPAAGDEPAHVTPGAVASRNTAVPTTDGALLDDDTAELEENKHAAEIQKLVESKTYFLPVNSVEKRRTKRLILLGIVLAVVLALAWADIALDAGLINIEGVKPVTHFFSN